MGKKARKIICKYHNSLTLSLETRYIVTILINADKLTKNSVTESITNQDVL